jgi:heparan-alpha-glucosaminide N-acetyltransferase
MPQVTPSSSNLPPSLPPSVRLASIDAYRGLVMLLMMAEVLRLKRVAQALPESGVWRWLAGQQTHVDWAGSSLHDFIQPSFSFLVGVALAFSLARRQAQGQSWWRGIGHAWGRALMLILLGVALRSTGTASTNWTFEDTLTQIGLGYGLLYLVALRPVRDHALVLGAILGATWAAFALWPLPGAEFDYGRVGVSAAWLERNGLGGFAAHWQKNSNLAWAFDTWWLNLFPRMKSFVFNAGGYATLSFIPTLATMVLGLMAGHVLGDPRTPDLKVRWLVRVGFGALFLGAALGWLGVCPVVKRIWTPSWVLYSGGVCCLALAFFYRLLDGPRRARWAFPILVIGTNSMAAYLIAHLCEGFIEKTLRTHFGMVFDFFGEAYQPIVLGASSLGIMWLLLYALWRRKLFLKL